MIKVIAFDLDDTLWAVKPIIIRAEKKLNDFLHQSIDQLEYDVERMRELRDEVIQEDPTLVNQITEFRRRLIVKALEKSGQTPARADLVSREAIEVFLKARNEIEFFEGVLETIELLAEDFILGALTNGNADVGRLGLDKYFSFAFSAEDVGAPKPAPNLFEHAMRHNNISAAAMLYVGDHPVHDIDAAKALGLRTVWVKNRDWDELGDHEPDETISHVSELPAALARLKK